MPNSTPPFDAGTPDEIEQRVRVSPLSAERPSDDEAKIAEVMARTGCSREEVDAINHLTDVCGDSQGENDMAMAIIWGALIDARAEISALRSSLSAERIAPEPWVIWSNEHWAWWRANAHGYTPNLLNAGIYTEAAAREIEANANRSRGGRKREKAMPLLAAVRDDAFITETDTHIVADYLLAASGSGLSVSERKEPTDG